MRTTINIDEQLLSQAKMAATRANRTLGSVIEDALRSALQPASAARQRRRVTLPVSRGSGGLRPGVNLDSTTELLEIMEGPHGPS